MKIQELLEAKKFKKANKHVDIDDTDEPAPDADQDKIPLVTMQMLKALDVDGNYPITFRDGKKAKLRTDDIKKFLMKYMSARPHDKESMQDMASNSLEGFHRALEKYEVQSEPKHKIKGTRYMSHFKGDFDDK